MRAARPSRAPRPLTVEPRRDPGAAAASTFQSRPQRDPIGAGVRGVFGAGERRANGASSVLQPCRYRRSNIRREIAARSSLCDGVGVVGEQLRLPRGSPPSGVLNSWLTWRGEGAEVFCAVVQALWPSRLMPSESSAISRVPRCRCTGASAVSIAGDDASGAREQPRHGPRDRACGQKCQAMPLAASTSIRSAASATFSRSP